MQMRSSHGYAIGPSCDLFSTTFTKGVLSISSLLALRQRALHLVRSWKFWAKYFRFILIFWRPFPCVAINYAIEYSALPKLDMKQREINKVMQPSRSAAHKSVCRGIISVATKFRFVRYMYLPCRHRGYQISSRRCWGRWRGRSWCCPLPLPNFTNSFLFLVYFGCRP